MSLGGQPQPIYFMRNINELMSASNEVADIKPDAASALF
jgi:hypothetical protein